MSTAVLSKCPGCKKVLRMPDEWSDKTVKCKHCGMICQAKPSAALKARLDALKAPPPMPIPQHSAAPKPLAVPAPQPAPTAIVPTAPVFTMPANAPPASMRAMPANAWEAITDPVAPAAGKGRYRRRRNWAPTAVAFGFLLLCFGGLFAGWKYRDKIQEFFAKNDPKNRNATNQVLPSGDGSGKPSDIPTGKGKFPRRILGISANSYLYCNPTSYGSDAKSKAPMNHDFGSVLERLANKLHIDSTQVYEVSDSSSRRKPIPPLKPIIEQTIARFVDTCRPQDNVLVLLSGHLAEVNDKAYFVPLEGDLEDEKSLLPLQWVMEQMARCQAQQKVLIVDACRYDPARGFERQSGGKMSAKVEKVLKEPPAGVQVWSACSNDEYSYEFDDFAQFDTFSIKGSLFLNMFFYTLGQGIAIQKESDPIPVESMAAKVNADTTRVVKGLVNDKQTPFLAGTMRQERVPYDPEQAVAAKIDIPTPAEVFGGNLAPAADVQKLLAEIDVPPIKQARNSDAVVKFDAVVPFSADAMKAYADDGVSIEEIKKNPEKYPLRFATVKAIEELRMLKEKEAAEADLPETISPEQITDANKQALLRIQRSPARVQLVLRNLNELLEKAAEDRKEEKSKRWQANFDFVVAMVKARLAYIHEYNLMVGRIRKEDLPELDKKLGQNGWRLSSQKGLQSAQEIKDQARDAQKLFGKFATDHKGTPWEVLGKRMKQTTLGLKWVPTNLGEDVNVK